MNHNDYLFRKDAEGFTFLRQFDDMYQNCPDPHGQADAPGRIDYQMVLTLCPSLVGQKSNPSVLDVGCGLGYFTRHLKRALPGAIVRGCDISHTAVERAGFQVPQCQFFHLDLKAPPPETAFDLILAMHVLCYFTEDEIAGVIGNLRAMLAPGGYLVVGHNLPDEMSFGRYMRSLADAKALFEAHGFAMRFSMDLTDNLGTTYAGTAIGRGLYFAVQKI